MKNKQEKNRETRFMRRVGGSLPGIPINGNPLTNMERRASLGLENHTTQITPHHGSMSDKMMFNMQKDSALGFMIPLDESSRFLKRGIGSNIVFKSIEHEIQKNQTAKFIK